MTAFLSQWVVVAALVFLAGLPCIRAHFLRTDPAVVRHQAVSGGLALALGSTCLALGVLLRPGLWVVQLGAALALGGAFLLAILMDSGRHGAAGMLLVVVASLPLNLG